MAKQGGTKLVKVSAAAAAWLMKRKLARMAKSVQPHPGKQLNSTQKEVVALMRKGVNVGQIGDKLGITKQGVERRLVRAYVLRPPCSIADIVDDLILLAEGEIKRDKV